MNHKCDNRCLHDDGHHAHPSPRADECLCEQTVHGLPVWCPKCQASPPPTISREDFIKEWIKDLRTTTIGQTRYALCMLENGVPTHACCLGIACLTGQRLGIKGAAFNDLHCEGYQNSANSYPGQWFVDLVGSDNPSILIEQTPMHCDYANDQKHCSFRTIADALEVAFLKGRSSNESKA